MSSITGQLEPPRLSFAFEVRARVGEPRDFGLMAHGRRRIVDILDGTFTGPKISGRVLPGGADWQSLQPDGFSRLDTRYALQTDEGALIYVQNAAIRDASPEVMRRLNAGEPVDPNEVYFRTMPRFETAAPDLQWLVRSVFVGTGARLPREVVIRFWRVE